MSGVLGTKTAKFDKTPTVELMNFLKNYNTQNVDETLGNLTQYASNASQTLQNMPDYKFGVDASEQARKDIEQATFDKYMNKLQPQFTQQTDDLQSRLVNQGLSVGSEAYQRAFDDLQRNQNQAVQDASYQSVLAGNEAYSQDLANQINASNFANQSQQNYINQLISALQGSSSSYDVAMDKYAAGSNLAKAQYNAKQQALNNKAALTNSLIKGMTGMGASYLGATGGAV